MLQTMLFLIAITVSITGMAETSGYDCKVENGKTVCKPKVFSPPSTPKIEDTQPTPVTSTKPQVEVYYAGWDPISMKALDFFRTYHIVVNAYDVEDPKISAIKRNLAPNFNGIPLVIINDVAIYGFDEQKYRQALNIGVIKPPQ